ncbi:MAG TPA: hypothetical protein DCQ34_03205 [Chitinophagaceae bacterium]|nr:hypothetical protein [Chitinophagaceae bacterium]
MYIFDVLNQVFDIWPSQYSGCRFASETTYIFIAMARVTEKGIVGLVGNLVFYTVNGKTYVRSEPGKRRKSRGKRAGQIQSVFGTVSRFGTPMLKAAAEKLSWKVGRDAYNRMRGWMRNLYAERNQDATWEISGRDSGMCQLNSEVDFRDCFRENITVTDKGKGMIQVTIPPFTPKLTLKSPVRTMKVNLKLIAVTSPFKEAGPRYSLCTEQISFTLQNKPVPATELVLHTKASAKNIAIIIAAIEYETTDCLKGQCITDPKWLPVAALAMGRLKK